MSSGNLQCPIFFIYCWFCKFLAWLFEKVFRSVFTLYVEWNFAIWQACNSWGAYHHFIITAGCQLCGLKEERRLVGNPQTVRWQQSNLVAREGWQIQNRHLKNLLHATPLVERVVGTICFLPMCIIMKYTSRTVQKSRVILLRVLKRLVGSE